jgi:hypothetical protein
MMQTAHIHRLDLPIGSRAMVLGKRALMKTKNKALVSCRALIQRLNRVLTKDGLLLKKTKGTRAQKQLGDYFLIDVKRNFVAEMRVDLERLGRKRGVLAAWEKVC